MRDKFEEFSTSRHSRRFQLWDYTQPAVFFVTVCAFNHRKYFGRVRNQSAILNWMGQIVEEEWHRTEKLRPDVQLDSFVVMPNHVPGIVVITPSEFESPVTPRGYNLRVSEGVTCRRSDMARHVATEVPKRKFASPQAGSLGTIIGAYKGAVSRRVNRIRRSTHPPVWQKNFFDRVLRNEHEWRAAREYIERNPAQWTEDTLSRR